MTNETIEDIVREDRRELELYNEYHDWEGYIEDELLPRIEAVFARQNNEIARLRVALKESEGK